MHAVNGIQAKVDDWIVERERQTWTLVRRARQAARALWLGSMRIGNVSISMDELMEDLSYGRD
jgi:hypothetical protein